MRHTITGIIFILLTIVASLYLASLSAYIQIVLPGWNLQTPLWVALLLVLGVFIVFLSLNAKAIKTPIFFFPLSSNL